MNKTQLEVFLEILEQGNANYVRFDYSVSGLIEIKVYSIHSDFVTFDFYPDGSIKDIE